MVADILDKLFILELLVGFRPVKHIVVVDGSAGHELAEELGISVEDLLRCDGMILCQLWRCLLLHLEELVGLQQHQVNLLEDLEVHINQALVTCYTSFQIDEIDGGDGILKIPGTAELQTNKLLDDKNCF